MPKLLAARPPRDAHEERQVRRLARSLHAPADWVAHARMIARSWDGLRTCVIRAELDDEVDIVVLRAVGDRAFCTGGDLVEGASTWSDRDALAQRLAEMDGIFPFQAFERCSKTILTAVNGLAQAAGLIAVLVSDLVVASDRARFRVPETLRGLRRLH